jgi:hypothetical protein
MLGRLRTIVEREFQAHPYLFGFVVVLTGLLLWAVVAPLHRRGVKNVILHGKRAIEAREVRELSSLLAENFTSSRTGDREATIEHVRREFKNIIAIEIKLKRIRIHVAGDNGDALVDFTIAGTIRGGEDLPQIPFRGLSGDVTPANPLERCRLTFVKESDGRWRISGAELVSATAESKRTDGP